MHIDIHRHSPDSGGADLVIRNMFPHQKLDQTCGGYVSVGLHPWHVSQATLEHDMEEVRKKSKSGHVLAIGEAGLDKLKPIDFGLQKTAFELQLEIAAELEKPMIIHCVKSYNEILQYKMGAPGTKPWILHWFNGSYEMAMDFIKNGCYVSFGISLFKETSKTFKAFRRIPLDHVFFETDDANITIQAVYKQAARIRGIEIGTLEKTIKENFQNCFQVSL